MGWSLLNELMNDAIGIDHLTRNPAGLAIVSESGDSDSNGIHYLRRTLNVMSPRHCVIAVRLMSGLMADGWLRSMTC
jgi:hypothetical protein